MAFTPEYLARYRVRIVSDMPGYRVVDFGMKLRSARDYAAQCSVGTCRAEVEAYDRHTGETLRIVTRPKYYLVPAE